MSRRRKKKTDIKRIEFAQKLAMRIIYFSMGIVGVTILLNFTLLWFSKEPMTNETVTAIGTYGGITASSATFVYGALAGWRDHSKNKNGITLAEMEGKNEEHSI